MFPLIIPKYFCCRLLQTWIDEFLTWIPEENEGVQYLTISPEDIWMPDITLYEK